MTYAARHWAVVQPVKTQGERLVLMALAECCDEKHECYPSHKYLAEFALCSVATVKRVLKRLEDAGFVQVTPRFKGNARSSNLYTLPLAQNELPPAQFDLTPSSPSELTPSSSSELGNSNVNSNENSKWGPTPDGVDPKAWEDLADYKRGSPKQATLTRNANLLRKYPPEVQRQMVDDCIRSGWQGIHPPKGNSHASTGRSRETVDQKRARLRQRIAEIEGDAGVVSTQ